MKIFSALAAVVSLVCTVEELAIGQQEEFREGPMLRVSVASGQISVLEGGQRRIINTVPKDTRLWALATKGDFYRVVDPESLEAGWIWKKHVATPQYSEPRLNRINGAFASTEEGMRLSRAGEHLAAEKQFDQSLKTLKENLGADHPFTADAMMNLAMCYVAQKRTTDAASVLMLALSICKRSHGPGHEYTKHVQTQLAQIEKEQGNATEGESVVGAPMPVKEEAKGSAPPSPAPADAQTQSDVANSDAVSKEDAKNTPKNDNSGLSGTMLVVTDDWALIAIDDRDGSLLDSATKGTRLWALKTGFSGDGRKLYQVLGPDTGQYGWILESSVKPVTFTPGQEDELTRTLKILQRKENLPPDADYLNAIEINRGVIQTFEKHFGSDHPYLAVVLHDQALLHLEVNNYAAAGLLLKKCVSIAERMLGGGYSLTADYKRSLGMLYYRQVIAPDAGQYGWIFEDSVKPATLTPEQEAELTRTLKILQRKENLPPDADYLNAIEINRGVIQTFEKHFGSDHPYLAYLLHNQAQLQLEVNNYAAAELLLKKSVSMAEKMLGGRHEWTADFKSTLGMIYYRIGDYEAAAEPLAEAANVFLHNLGLHERTADASLNVARVLGALKRTDEARKILNIAEGIYYDKYKFEHPGMADCMELEAKLLYPDETRMDEKARVLKTVLLSTARSSREKTLGPDHVETARAVSNDARFFADWYDDSSRSGRKLLKAAQIAEKAAGLDHPDTGLCLFNLAMFQHRKGQIQNVMSTMDKWHQGNRGYLAKILPGLSDSDRHLFIRSESREVVAQTLTLACANQDDIRIATLSAGWVLNSKAVQQEVAAEAAVLTTPEAAPLVRQLKHIRSKISGLSTQKQTPEISTMLADLATQQEQLQQQITALGFRQKQSKSWISTGTLMSEIPVGSVLVNVLRFPEYEFGGRKPGEDIYAAWIVPSTGVGDVHVVRLGTAEKIDAAVKAVRNRFAPEELNTVRKSGERAVEAALHTELAELSKLILSPLEPHLQDVKEIILSPDSNLWTVPWESLITKSDRYLIEKYQTRYVLSGRELVAKQRTTESTGQPVIFADADFDLKAEKIATKDEHQRHQLRSGPFTHVFAPLAASAAEANAIRPAIEAHTRKQAIVHLQADAQEAVFKDLNSPDILVMSTHGYFAALSESETSRVTVLNNPFLRCGLALAGSNRRDTLATEGKEDGILTGLEILGTDLRGTELVVLSACQTGLGDIQNGEGVAGLRQAFQLAGAQSVISSLWQVEDGETARLMKDFFANLADGMTKSEALRQAKLTRIKARRQRHGAAHPFFWAAFTLTGQE